MIENLLFLSILLRKIYVYSLVWLNNRYLLGRKCVKESAINLHLIESLPSILPPLSRLSGYQHLFRLARILRIVCHFAYIFFLLFRRFLSAFIYSFIVYFISFLVKVRLFDAQFNSLKLLHPFWINFLL